MPVPDIVIEKLSELMSIARGMRAKRRLRERVGRSAGSPGGQRNACAILGATELAASIGAPPAKPRRARDDKRTDMRLQPPRATENPR